MNAQLLKRVSFVSKSHPIIMYPSLSGRQTAIFYSFCQAKFNFIKISGSHFILCFETPLRRLIDAGDFRLRFAIKGGWFERFLFLIVNIQVRLDDERLEAQILLDYGFLHTSSLQQSEFKSNSCKTLSAKSQKLLCLLFI